MLLALLALGVASALAWLSRGPFERYRTGRQFARAQELLGASQDDAGAAELRSVLERDAAHPAARLALARLELKRGRIEHAFLHFEAYSELVPLDPEGWLGLAEVRSRAGQPQEMEAVLGRAIELLPARADLRRRRAELRYREGHLHGALVDAEASVAGDPRDVDAWVVLCSATFLASGKETAAQASRRAVAAAGADPRLIELGNHAPPPMPPPGPAPRAPALAENWPGDLGQTIREFSFETRQRSWTTAAQMARSARKRYPGTMVGPWLEGAAAQGEGILPRAEAAYLEALALSPRSHRVVSNLVAVWSKQHGPEYTGDQLVGLADRDPGFTYPLPIAAQAYLEAARPTKAEAIIRRLLLRPDSPDAYRAAADFYLRVDRAGESMAAAEQGLARFPSDAELRTLQGRGALLLGDREAALRAYDAAVAAHPDDSAAMAQLARLLARTRTDAASRQRALRLVRDLELDRPADPEVLAAMGAATLSAGGDPRRALPWLQAARDGSPDDPGIRYHLALAWSRAGDRSAARRELQEALKSGRPFDEEPEARRLSRELGVEPERAAQSPR